MSFACGCSAGGAQHRLCNHDSHSESVLAAFAGRVQLAMRMRLWFESLWLSGWLSHALHAASVTRYRKGTAAQMAKRNQKGCLRFVDGLSMPTF